MQWAFTTTSWSQIVVARDGNRTDSRQALEALCRAYWNPIYALVRRQCNDPEAARDLTQAYFTALLDKGYLHQVDPARGRFRAFLMASVKHFLSKERDKEHAAKRGGRTEFVHLDAPATESRYRFEPASRLTPEAVFERRWALTVLERALGKLESELGEAGKGDQFGALKGFLTGEEPKVPYRQVAIELGVSERVVGASVHRLRRRFGKLLRNEIAETVADRRQVDDELRYLLGVIAPLEARS